MPSGAYERKHLRPIEERFFKKIKKTETCWIWCGAKSSFGHGQLMKWVDGKKVIKQAHRISWEIHFGKIPKNMCILHKCDIPACVNPAHLFIGTKKDNTIDMINKGRCKTGNSLPQAKLNPEKVRTIRCSTLPQNELAEMFAVSQATVSLVRGGKYWKNVI